MIDDVIETAEKGMRGENIELAMKIHPKSDQKSKLGSIISLSKARYFLAGGISGSGKTAFMDSEFVLKPFENYIRNGGIRPFWIYRLMERPLLERKTKWLCWKIYIDKGILYDVPTIFGSQNKLRDLTPKDIELFKSYTDYFTQLLAHVDLVAGATSPDEILKYILRRAYQRGKLCGSKEGKWVVNDKPVGDMKGSDSELRQGVKKFYKDFEWGRVWEGEWVYFDFHPDEMMLHMSDHLGKLTGQASEMALINEHGKNMGDIVRDILKWTVYDIMQFNREIHDTQRQLKTQLQVTERDFRMSSVPFHNADVVFGLLNPKKYNKTKHRGYDMDRMQNGPYNRFRGLDIIKNSYGNDDISLGYMFVGEAGYMHELPPGEDMLETDYENYKNAKINNYV